jgi:hypothetical protein
MNYLTDSQGKIFVLFDSIKLELGTLKDLAEDELISQCEIERQIVKAGLGPVLLLPVKNRKNGYHRAWDYSEEIGFNAFGTVDFDRYRPEFDKARYKAGKLREQLRDLVIIIRIVHDRITGTAKHHLPKMLSLAKRNIIDPDDIEHWDSWQFVKMFMRALRIKKEILGLEEKSRQGKSKKYQKWLDSLG